MFPNSHLSTPHARPLDCRRSLDTTMDRQTWPSEVWLTFFNGKPFCNKRQILVAGEGSAGLDPIQQQKKGTLFGFYTAGIHPPSRNFLLTLKQVPNHQCQEKKRENNNNKSSCSLTCPGLLSLAPEKHIPISCPLQVEATSDCVCMCVRVFLKAGSTRFTTWEICRYCYLFPRSADVHL